MKSDKLVVVWLSADKQAAIDMAMLYTRDSILNRWWNEAELVLWGPSVETAAESEAIQHELSILMNIGVGVVACQACAIRYGVIEKLELLGIEVKGMSKQLTEYLRNDFPVIFI